MRLSSDAPFSASRKPLKSSILRFGSIGSRRCRQAIGAENPVCHDSRKNSPDAEGHPAQPIVHRHAMRPVTGLQVENFGADRRQSRFEDRVRLPMP
jgi:hypothetical protein